MKMLIKTRIHKDYNFVFSKFNQDLFKSLKPPLLNLEVLRFDGCKKGDEIHLNIGFGPFSIKWISHITENSNGENENLFIDEGYLLPPPLKYWKHIHRVKKISEDLCEIQDDIEFSSGNQFLDTILYPTLYFQFSLRNPAYKKFFKSF